jgi:hypothetical protein
VEVTGVTNFFTTMLSTMVAPGVQETDFRAVKFAGKTIV